MAILREVRPGDVAHITELKMARAHTHVFDNDKSPCLPLRVKQLLAPLVHQKGTRCQKAFNTIEAGGVCIVDDFPATEKHKNQVMSFLRRERLRCNGGWWQSTFGALSTFVDANVRTYSELREAFSGKPDNTDGMHDFFVTECSVVDDGGATGTKIIRVTASTAHLARNNERDANMRLGGQKCVDGTFRVCYHGMPVLFGGVVDMMLHFHMTCVQFTYAEDGASLTSLLRADVLCADAVAEDTEFSLVAETEFSMNDNNDASFNAVGAVLTNVARKGNCAVHMLRNIKKKQYKDKDANCKPLMEALKFISKTTIAGGYDALLIDAFVRMYKPLEPEVVRVWEQEYTGSKGHWQYSKSEPTRPNHNNAIEGFNSAFKEDGTFREQLAVGPFLDQLQQFVTTRSKMDAEFANSVVIELDDWRTAQIVAGTPGYLDLRSTAKGYVFILSTVTHAQLANLQKSEKGLKAAARAKLLAYSYFATKPVGDDFNAATKSMSFDELRETGTSCYHMFALRPSERRFGPEILYQCSRPQFWHRGKCKHALGYAIYKKEIAVPAKYRLEKVGRNRKAGRPASAKGGDALSKK